MSRCAVVEGGLAADHGGRQIAYGPDFAGPSVDEQTFVEHLTSTAVRYLLGQADVSAR